MRYPELEEIIQKIRFQAESHPCIVAIDGRCATGKSTFAEVLQQELACPLVHMDDFFLPQELRGNSHEIGSNIHQKAVREQVLQPFSQGKEAEYAVFDCKKGIYREKIKIPPQSILLVEGVYCQLPSLQEFYDVTIFLTATWELRQERLWARGGEALLEQFLTQWIPREELYFSQCTQEISWNFLVDTNEF